MLTLILHLDGDRVAVEADGAPSHSFPLADIRLTPEQARAFWNDPSACGARLFAALFPEGSPARRKLDALPLAPHPDGVLLLGIPVPAPGVPDLHSVPWEYLCDGRNWLATRYGMARALTPSPQPPSPSPVERERGRGWPEGPGVGVRAAALHDTRIRSGARACTVSEAWANWQWRAFSSWRTERSGPGVATTGPGGGNVPGGTGRRRRKAARSGSPRRGRWGSANFASTHRVRKAWAMPSHVGLSPTVRMPRKSRRRRFAIGTSSWEGSENHRLSESPIR